MNLAVRSSKPVSPQRHWHHCHSTSKGFSAPCLQVIEDNKQLLKAKYDQAKALGAAVNASKAHINELRAHIEQRRMQRSAACEYDRGSNCDCFVARAPCHQQLVHMYVVCLQVLLRGWILLQHWPRTTPRSSTPSSRLIR